MKKLNNSVSFMAIFAIVALILAPSQVTNAQGCVAIQGMGCTDSRMGNTDLSSTSKGVFSISANHRYFSSFRHFRGDEEEKHRVDNCAEVINKSHFLDLGIGYGVTDQLSINAYIPFSFHDRSSLYEHYGNSL